MHSDLLWLASIAGDVVTTQLSLDPLIKFKDNIIIFCFYHDIAQAMLNQEFFSLLILIKYIPIKQGLWTIVYSKKSWQRVIAYKYESQHYYE